MSIQNIRDRIEVAVAEERSTGHLAKHLEDHFKLAPRIVRALIAFIIQYVRASPELLAQAGMSAQKQKILKQFNPILKEAISYWGRKLDVKTAPGKLMGLADEAYLTSALVQFVAAIYEGSTGSQLLSQDFHKSNLVMRQLLGRDNAVVLDSVLAQTMHGRPIQLAIRNLKEWRGPLELNLRKIESAGVRGPVSLGEAQNALLPIDELSVVAPSPARQETKGGISYRVWYATNREPLSSDDFSKGFKNKPDPNNEVRYGTCYVFVPECHKPGSLGSPWPKRWLKLNFEDDHLRIITHKGLSDATEFFRNLSGEIKALDPEMRHLLVYIHGFYVSFENAVLRAAQIGADLQVPGETVFFSWPSHAKKNRYEPDAVRLENSELVLRDFLIRIVKDSGAKAVHIIAHSMGNRGLIRVAAGLHSSGVKFANIILAAPDVDQTFFYQYAGSYPLIANRTTLYASSRDLALKVAANKYLSNGPRAGLIPPVTIVPSIDTVQVTQFNLLDFGHGYWAKAREVVTDIYQLMRYSAAPPRLGLNSKVSPKGKFWVLK
jgi:esterase/lipase superfamily enzyme